MRQLSRVTMGMRELDRLKVIQAVLDGELPGVRAAQRLLVSARQIRRMLRRYRAEGPVGLISLGRGHFNLTTAYIMNAISQRAFVISSYRHGRGLSLQHINR